MNFGITLEADIEAVSKIKFIHSLSDNLKEHLSNKMYGQSIQHFFIGCICVKQRPGYEDWFKIRKPKYKDIDKIRLLDGSLKESYGVFSYDIKLNFETFINTTEEESKRLLASEILNSLSNFDALPPKVKDFDKERFRADMEQFFKEQDLILQ